MNKLWANLVRWWRHISTVADRLTDLLLQDCVQQGVSVKDFILHFHYAQGCEETVALSLDLPWEPTAPLPAEPLNEWADRCAARHQAEGQRLEIALRHHLPGGTYDALFAAMATYRARQDKQMTLRDQAPQMLSLLRRFQRGDNDPVLRHDLKTLLDQIQTEQESA
jgi:hypothetical protein